MRKIIYAMAAFGALVWPGAAWAVVQETTVTPADNGKPLPSATITLTRTDSQSPPASNTEKTDTSESKPELQKGKGTPKKASSDRGKGKKARLQRGKKGTSKEASPSKGKRKKAASRKSKTPSTGAADLVGTGLAIGLGIATSRRGHERSGHSRKIERHREVGKGGHKGFGLGF